MAIADRRHTGSAPQLIISNELLGKTVTITEQWPGSPDAGEPQSVSGSSIVNSQEYFGFNAWGDECPWGGITIAAVNGQQAACWIDLYVPALWFVCMLPLAILLLKQWYRTPLVVLVIAVIVGVVLSVL